MIYTVYILYSQTHDKIYIGYTSNLLERFKSHQKLGKDWTASFDHGKLFTANTLLKKEKHSKEKNNLNNTGTDFGYEYKLKTISKY